MKVIKHKDKWYLKSETGYKEILLSTDTELTRDGVQAIDDEFLEWFVKNPSCAEVESKRIFTPHKITQDDFCITCDSNGCNLYDEEKYNYKIIIPKEEPKQETLKEDLKFPIIIENGIDYLNLTTKIFNNGAKWQQERMYSEEEVKQIINTTLIEHSDFVLADIPEWFQQFKKIKTMWYKLDKENNPMICNDFQDYIKWEEENVNQKKVKQDTIGDSLVSTVFLSLDHSFGGEKPLLWETMIFGGEHDQYQDRYSSYEDALKGHQQALDLINNQENGE